MQYAELYALRIKQLCAKQGITINRLATISGLKQSTVDNIIRGTSKNPKARTLHKIAVAFNMTLSEFLNFPELNEYPIDEEEDDPNCPLGYDGKGENRINETPPLGEAFSS